MAVSLVGVKKTTMQCSKSHWKASCLWKYLDQGTRGPGNEWNESI